MIHSNEVTLAGSFWNENKLQDIGVDTNYQQLHWMRRIIIFVEFIEHLQGVNCKQDHSDSNKGEVKICGVLDIWNTDKCERDGEDFVKWKNSILKRNSKCNFCANKQWSGKRCLLVCKQCKSTYYCSRKCQKSDWSEHKNKCSNK